MIWGLLGILWDFFWSETVSSHQVQFQKECPRNERTSREGVSWVETMVLQPLLWMMCPKKLWLGEWHLPWGSFSAPAVTAGLLWKVSVLWAGDAKWCKIMKMWEGPRTRSPTKLGSNPGSTNSYPHLWDENKVPSCTTAVRVKWGIVRTWLSTVSRSSSLSPSTWEKTG